eukprot:2351272-Prymnesium_polylepis.1
MEMIDLHATHRSPLAWAARPVRLPTAALQRAGGRRPADEHRAGRLRRPPRRHYTVGTTPLVTPVTGPAVLTTTSN